MFSQRGELCPGHLYQSPPSACPGPKGPGVWEQQRGKTRANRRASLPGPRPSGHGTPCISWALPNSPRPPTLTKLKASPGLFTPRTLDWASTPKKELQRLAHHGLPRLPWPQLSVWTELSFLRTVLQPRVQGLHADSTCMPGGEDQGGHQRRHVWPRGATQPPEAALSQGTDAGPESEHRNRQRGQSQRDKSSVGSLLRDRRWQLGSRSVLAESCSHWGCWRALRRGVLGGWKVLTHQGG